MPGLLRPGLLEGVRLAFAVALDGEAPAPGPCATAAGALAASLDGQLATVGLRWSGEAESDETAAQQAMAAALAELGGLDVLVIDGDGLFAPAGGQDALLSCLGACWNAARAAAEAAFLKAGSGRVLMLAPAEGAGEHSAAAVASLENLARTLSIEWARHGVTVVTFAPGAVAEHSAVAEVLAYLASPAGAYFSGCLLDMRGAAGLPA